MSRRASGSVDPAYCRIDRGSEEHAASVVDAHGVELERFTVEHTAVGLARLLGRLRRAGVVEVGIERPDGALSTRCWAPT